MLSKLPLTSKLILPWPIINYIVELSNINETWARVCKRYAHLSMNVSYILYHTKVINDIRKTLQLPDSAFEKLRSEYVLRARMVYWLATYWTISNNIKTFDGIVEYYNTSNKNSDNFTSRLRYQKLACVYNKKTFIIYYFGDVVYNISDASKLYKCLACGYYTSNKTLPECERCNNRYNSHDIIISQLLTGEIEDDYVMSHNVTVSDKKPKLISKVVPKVNNCINCKKNKKHNCRFK